VTLRALRAPQVYVLTGGVTETDKSLFVRLTGFAGDFAILFAIAVGIPFAIIAVGLPIALLIRGVLWIAGQL